MLVLKLVEDGLNLSYYRTSILELEEESKCSYTPFNHYGGVTKGNWPLIVINASTHGHFPQQ